MSDENNKRYIGEVFIDGKSDKLLQEFLTNLFNSYMHHGNGFDADMVDGWHLDDFIEYIHKQTDDKLSYIKIGETTFNINNLEQFLNLSDVIYNEFQSTENAPWAQALLDDKNKSRPEINRLDSSFYGDMYSAQDIILDIYAVLDHKKIDAETFYILQKEVNVLKEAHQNLKDAFETFIQPFENIIRDVEITEIDDQGVEHTKIVKMFDAQLVNGFRIIPITQEDYNDLPLREKSYWRNIYIIVDEVSENYIDPISYNLFKDVKLVYNHETQYLDYYDGISDKPRPLISLVDLLAGVDFSEQISDFVSNNPDYTINTFALKNSLKEMVINQNEYTDMPFLLKDESRILISNITSNQGTISSTTNDKNFMTFDISNAFDTKFSSLQQSLETQIGVISGDLSDFKSVVGSNYVKTQVYTTDKQSLEGSIATINQNLSNEISNLKQENKVLKEKIYKNSLKILIGRYNQKDGEYGTRIIVPNEGNGLYARILCDDPNFAQNIDKINVYIDFKGVMYEFNTTRANETPPRGLKVEKQNNVTTIVTDKLTIKRPENERGTEYMIQAIAKYTDSDGVQYPPAYTGKMIKIEGP